MAEIPPIPPPGGAAMRPSRLKLPRSNPKRDGTNQFAAQPLRRRPLNCPRSPRGAAHHGRGAAAAPVPPASRSRCSAAPSSAHPPNAWPLPAPWPKDPASRIRAPPCSTVVQGLTTLDKALAIAPRGQRGGMSACFTWRFLEGHNRLLKPVQVHYVFTTT